MNSRNKGMFGTGLMSAAMLVGVQALAADQWTGANSSDFTFGGNWNDGIAPDQTSAATIGNNGSASLFSDADVGTLWLGSAGDSGHLFIGNLGSLTNFFGAFVGNSGEGSVTVAGSSDWQIDSTLSIGMSAAGQVSVVGGSYVFVQNEGRLGVNAGSTGSMEVSGTDSEWFNSGAIFVGSEGTGNLLIEDGGLVQAGTDVFLGDLTGSSGSVTVTGASSQLNFLSPAATFYVGNEGEGSALVADGAQLTSSGVEIASKAGSSGTVQVTDANSLWDISGPFYVGTEGTAEAEILNGGVIQSTATAILGQDPGASGSMLVSGTDSLWTSNQSVRVGDHGTGELNISAGGTVSAGVDMSIGMLGGSGTVIVTGPASTLTVTQDLSIGEWGEGQLSLADQGSVQAGNIVYIALEPGSTGILNIGNGGAAGLLDVAELEFGSGDGTLNFNHSATDYNFSTTISGSGAINQLAGVTQMSGDSSGFNGTITVSGGELLVNGLVGGEMSVNTGTLGGTGSVGTVGINSGATLSPGNSIGTLTANGNWTLAAGATFVVELADGGNTPGVHSDLMDVVGAAIVEDGALLHVTPENGSDDGSNYADGTSYTIIQADGGLTVNGTQILSDDYAYLDFTTSHDDSAYYLTSSLALEEEPEPEPEPQPIQSFCLSEMTDNQCLTGDNVFTLGAGHDVYDQVLNMSEAQAQAALTALSGELHAGSRALLVQQSGQLRRAVLNRLHQTDDGDGAWLDLLGDQTRLDGDINTARLDADDYGVLLGADTTLDNDWHLGLFTGYSNSHFDLASQAASGKADNLHLGAYGSRNWNALSLHLGLGYSWHSLETERQALGQQLNANHNADTLQSFVEAAYRITLGDGWVQPFAGVAAVEQHQDGFREDGGSAALNVAGGKTTTGFTTLGLRGGTGLMPGSLSARVYGSLGWRYAFNDLTASSRHGFVSSSNLSFNITGAPLARNSALIETGLNLQLTDSATLNLNYQGEFSSDARVQSVNLQLGMAF